MEMLVKKYQQKYRKVSDELDRWKQLQSRLLAQFRNASSIIERLAVLHNPKNYVGGLGCVNGLMEMLSGKQMISLDAILCSIDETMREFHSVVISLEKILRDGRQLVKGGSVTLTEYQMELHIGIHPSIADCLEGLRLVHEMHHSEYLLKLSEVSKLSSLMLQKSGCASDLAVIEHELVDQPNIQMEEVKHIFDIIFAEAIC